MTDPKGARREKNEVEYNSIFREHVAKEKKHAFLNENFDFNPKNLFAVTEKPTRTVVTQQGEDMDMLKTKLGTLLQKPKQKF
jgi:hypothetical protein